MMKLLTGHWYGWQVLPDAPGAPTFSVIRLCAVRPDPMDRGTVHLTFIDTRYLAAAALSRKRLTVLHCTAAHLFARVREEAAPPSAVALFELTPAWLARCRPDIALQLGAAPSAGGLQQALDTLLQA
jgi:hypothetical protein